MRDLNNVCGHALSLLKSLPRNGTPEDALRTQLDSFRTRNPGISAELVTSASAVPGYIDYDLLIRETDGTIGISWRPHDGLPWTFRYCEHPDATAVVSVNNVRITVQDALLLFELNGADESNLRGRLLRYALTVHAIRENPPFASELEIQAAQERFRRNRGLLSEQATRQWLDEVGLTPQAIRRFLRILVQTGKLRRSVTRDQLKPVFDEHPDAFDLLAVATLTVRDAHCADFVASRARQVGLLAAVQTIAMEGNAHAVRLQACLSTQRRHELAPSLRAAQPGAIVGPFSVPAGGFTIAQVLHGCPARFDADTQAAIEDKLFDEWLDERRRTLDVRWYVRR
jgi:putative peptide maturation system protein